MQNLIQQVWGWGLKFCISNKLPGDAAGLWTSPWEAKIQRIRHEEKNEVEGVGKKQRWKLESPRQYSSVAPYIKTFLSREALGSVVE